MPLDELGLDPYQRAAVTSARYSTVFATVAWISGVCCYQYGAKLGKEGEKLTNGGLVLGLCGFLAVIYACKRLSREGLQCTNAILPGP